MANAVRLFALSSKTVAGHRTGRLPDPTWSEPSPKRIPPRERRGVRAAMACSRLISVPSQRQPIAGTSREFSAAVSQPECLRYREYHGGGTSTGARPLRGQQGTRSGRSLRDVLPAQHAVNRTDTHAHLLRHRAHRQPVSCGLLRALHRSGAPPPRVTSHLCSVAHRNLALLAAEQQSVARRE
jgi:hypothetical protein